tara:strand:+ start:161 stop:484 length:324 start_codon:yes stop_codon:yes gene_type:complete
MSDAASVLNHHLHAFSVGVDEIMKDYTEESVLFTPDGILEGMDAIREFFDKFVASLTPEDWNEFELMRKDTKGDFAYITWKIGIKVPLGTDTYWVRNGKIQMQSYAS